jgi:hypothetical protein
MKWRDSYIFFFFLSAGTGKELISPFDPTTLGDKLCMIEYPLFNTALFLELKLSYLGLFLIRLLSGSGLFNSMPLSDDKR